MPGTGDVPATAIVSVPPWMWGGDPSGFFAEAGLRPRVVGPGTDRWRVHTLERYAHVPSSLATAGHLAGPTVRGRGSPAVRVFESGVRSLARFFRESEGWPPEIPDAAR